MAGWFTESLYPHHAQRLEITEILYQSQTDQQDLVIFRNPAFGRVLALDGIVQTTERDEFIYHEMLTHVPMVSHGAARRVLVIGGGDGGTIREVLRHPVERVCLVEIDRSVIGMCRKYLPSISRGAFDDPRVEVCIRDGAAFVRDCSERFDVIIVDSTDPVGPGEILFSREFYQDCATRLGEGGIIATQNGVPAFQADELRNTSRHFRQIFPWSGCYVGVIPSYYGGFMTFCMASRAEGFALPDPATLQARARHLTDAPQGDGRPGYYSPHIHGAAFVLPPYLEAIARGSD